MNQKYAHIAHKCVNIATSVATAVVGVCLVSACLGIYKGGDGEFTRAAVANAFNKISVFVYIWLALVIVSTVCHFALSDKKANAPKPCLRYQLKRLYKKADLSSCNGVVAAERKKRSVYNTVLAGVTAVATVLYLFYALNSNNYTADISGSVAKTAVAFVICFAVPACLYVLFSVLGTQSIKREIAVLKTAEKKTDAVSVPHGIEYVQIVRAVLLVAGIALVAVGVSMGGMADVLAKAINICTECVGLG